uniref:Uncharacterized protein n=1 Tax=Solanum tuberosum TaxID=4113 RepID=M1AGQ0_SOLTU
MSHMITITNTRSTHGIITTHTRFSHRIHTQIISVSAWYPSQSGVVFISDVISKPTVSISIPAWYLSQSTITNDMYNHNYNHNEE